jgi:small subunit ribosomal protein S8
MMTDPIADMLTRIRNADAIRREKTDVPYSTIKEGILAVLKEEGFVKDYLSFGEGKNKTLRITLRYGPQRESIFTELKRASRPGRRVYKKVSELDPVVDGMGIAVVSTPRGVLSDRRCREENVGGEVLLTVW